MAEPRARGSVGDVFCIALGESCPQGLHISVHGLSTVETKTSGEVCKRDSWGWTGEGEEGFKVDLCLSVQYCVNQASVPWGKMSQGFLGPWLLLGMECKKQDKGC